MSKKALKVKTLTLPDLTLSKEVPGLKKLRKPKT
jgi:hypothetical protein